MQLEKMAGWLETVLSSSTGVARRFFLSTTTLAQKRCLSASSIPSETPDEKNKLDISDSCVARLNELGHNKVLRIAVDGGGCSGFQYSFELDTPIEEGDVVFKKNGAVVVVDETSLQYLQGATVDFHTELIRSAFRVVNNPLAEQGCSCGASFNIKIS